MNERPGPNSSYWLSNALATLPPHVYAQWLHSMLGSGMQMPEQPPQAPQEPAVFPVGGTNALNRQQQYQPQPMAFNALASPTWRNR